MKISNDGTVLLNVYSNDVRNDRFVTPKGVRTTNCTFSESFSPGQLVFAADTTVSFQSFYRKDGPKQVIISENVTVQSCAFYCCSNLSQINIHEGATFYQSPIIGCTNLKKIVIHTNSDAIVRKIGFQLSDYRYIIVKNPVYNEAIKIRESAYQKILNTLSPRPKNLIGIYSIFVTESPLPYEIVRNTLGYSQNLKETAKEAMDEIPLPTSTEELESYKHQLCLLIQQSHAMVQDINISGCIIELKKHLRDLKKEILQQANQNPRFYRQNKHIGAEVSKELTLIQKIISYLEGDENISFTDDEIKFTTQTEQETNNNFIGKTLDDFKITLPCASQSLTSFLLCL